MPGGLLVYLRVIDLDDFPAESRPVTPPTASRNEDPATQMDWNEFNQAVENLKNGATMLKTSSKLRSLTSYITNAFFATKLLPTDGSGLLHRNAAGQSAKVQQQRKGARSSSVKRLISHKASNATRKHEVPKAIYSDIDAPGVPSTCAKCRGFIQGEDDRLAAREYFLSSSGIPCGRPSARFFGGPDREVYLLLLSSLVVLSLADLPAIHEKEITLKVKSGGPLSIKIPAPTNIWHRKFKDNREAQYMEACNPFIAVCEKWRSGTLGKDVDPAKVSLAKDGTLNMPKVTSTDSAQYYTYYRANDGVHHYSYFDVIVA